MTILTDVNADTGPSDADAIAALTASMVPAKGAKSAPADDADEEDEDDTPPIADADDSDDEDGGDDEPSDDDEDDSEGEGDDEPSTPPADEKPAQAATGDVSDDAVVKVTVDGQETEFTVGSLKRLAGQEAALTRKSQEADLVGGRAATVLHGALESVLEDLEPYKDLDWVLEGRRMDDDEFEWHRNTYNRLTQRYNKLVNAAQELDGTISQKQSTAQTEAASAMRSQLADPKEGIQGFDDKLFSDIKAFGIAQGLDAADLEGVTSAPVVKLIHKAMLYDKGKAAASEKLGTAPAKVRKSAGREAIAPLDRQTINKKIASGNMSDDDAINALVGRWK